MFPFVTKNEYLGQLEIVLVYKYYIRGPLHFKTALLPGAEAVAQLRVPAEYERGGTGLEFQHSRGGSRRPEIQGHPRLQSEFKTRWAT